MVGGGALSRCDAAVLMLAQSVEVRVCPAPMRARRAIGLGCTWKVRAAVTVPRYEIRAPDGKTASTAMIPLTCEHDGTAVSKHDGVTAVRRI